MQQIRLKDLLKKGDLLDESNVTIYSFDYHLNQIEGVYDLSLEVSTLTYRSCIRFILTLQNAVEITLKGLTNAFNVQGFEIIDHKEDGWCNSMRYEINDFETSRIKLFCEKIGVDIV